MTPKQIVVKHDPEMWCAKIYCIIGWRYVVTPDGLGIIGSGSNAREAWKNAAKFLDLLK